MRRRKIGDKRERDKVRDKVNEREEREKREKRERVK